VTVFRVDEKLFGVESDKVFKLFRVPNTFHDKYSNQEKIRLKDFEVKLIDLKKIFSVQGGDRRGETNILTVKEDGQYKGLIVDQVLRKLSAPTEVGREYGDYFVGMIRWTYQEHSVEIPILDLKKF
jgi:chemotaxis protein histidine kinase CheA